MLRYTGNLDLLVSKYGFKKVTSFGHRIMKKEVIESNYSYSTIYIGLSKSEVDFGWAISDYKNISNGIIAITDYDDLCCYGSGIFPNENHIYIQDLIKDGVVEKVVVE